MVVEKQGKGLVRASNRIKEGDKRKIIDDTARKRRLRKMIEHLNADNHHDDPHADLVMSKKIPKFDDNLESRSTRTKKKEKSTDYYANKYRKTLAQLLEDDRKDAEEEGRPSYADTIVPPCNLPVEHFCAVCGNYSKYLCISCGAHICRLSCVDNHYETRCLKWAS